MRLQQSPAVVRSNSRSTKDSIFVYWVSPKGEIQPAADSRITEAQLQRWPEYRNWRRMEAVGVREIEKISLIISRQAWEKKKIMTVQQHLREKSELDQLVVRSRLRRAQGFSKFDVEVNQRILDRAKKTEDSFMDMIASQFTPEKRTTALEMEVREASTSPLANVNRKQEGIQS
jgi:hypothetical protein